MERIKTGVRVPSIHLLIQSAPRLFGTALYAVKTEQLRTGKILIGTLVVDEIDNAR